MTASIWRHCTTASGEIQRILEHDGKIDRTVEYAVDDEEEEYEQYHGFSMMM